MENQLLVTILVSNSYQVSSPNLLLRSCVHLIQPTYFSSLFGSLGWMYVLFYFHMLHLPPTLNYHLDVLADCCLLTAVPSRCMNDRCRPDADSLSEQHMGFAQLLNALCPATCFAWLPWLRYLSCMLASKFLKYLYMYIYKHASHLDTGFSGYLNESGSAVFGLYSMNAFSSLHEKPTSDRSLTAEKWFQFIVGFKILLKWSF